MEVALRGGLWPPATPFLPRPSPACWGDQAATPPHRGQAGPEGGRGSLACTAGCTRGKPEAQRQWLPQGHTASPWWPQHQNTHPHCLAPHTPTPCPHQEPPPGPLSKPCKQDLEGCALPSVLLSDCSHRRVGSSTPPVFYFFLHPQWPPIPRPPRSSTQHSKPRSAGVQRACEPSDHLQGARVGVRLPRPHPGPAPGAPRVSFSR